MLRGKEIPLTKEASLLFGMDSDVPERVNDFDTAGFGI
jgi:hypothetical protein